MSNVTFAPIIVGELREAVPAGEARSSRLRGVLAGLAFLTARVPFYIGAALLAAAVCVIGVALFAVQAALAHAVGNAGAHQSGRAAANSSFGGRHA